MANSVKKQKFLAVIPARQGSKRLPNKNTVNFCGKPLIHWTIEAALDANLADSLLISTNDERVHSYSNIFKNIKFAWRPDHLAKDESSLIDVILQAVSEYTIIPEYTVLLQPTSPLRTAEHIKQAISLIEKYDSVISVVKSAKPREWINYLPNDMDMKHFLGEVDQNLQSQELGNQYVINGAIYIAKTDRLIREKTFLLSSGCTAYEMAPECSVDIDTESDLFLATGFKKGLENALKLLDPE